jgi:hypothetical protein
MAIDAGMLFCLFAHHNEHELVSQSDIGSSWKCRHCGRLWSTCDTDLTGIKRLVAEDHFKDGLPGAKN